MSEYSISHWSLVGKRLVLNLISPGIYSLKIFESDLEIFKSNYQFQIHTSKEKNLIGLYVVKESHGWFLETVEYFDELEFDTLVIGLFVRNQKLMESIIIRN